MSEKSPKQQLMIARQQLDKLSIFIINLADFFVGTSPVIDDEFQQIKKLLAGKPEYDKAVEISASLNAKLKNESKFLQQKNANTLSQIQSSLRQLTELDAVNGEVKDEIKQFMSSLAPADDKNNSPVDHFEVALSLFRKALNNNLVSIKQKDKDEQAQLHEQITRELKELITPYYAKNNKDKVLVELNHKLSEGLGNKELLECCLVMIRFVVQDVLKEASSASKLINDIHGSLLKLNKGIHLTISKSKKRISQREKKNKAMKAQISAMENVLSDASNVGDLKEQTTAYLAQLQNSLDMSEQEDRVEQEKVIQLLQSMQKRLEELEEKAEAYKQKLVQQRIDAMTDSLTKLPNRMAYEEKIQYEWSLMQKNKTNAYMAVLDIDHFKQINDKYGHSVGDKTLQIIANHIRKLINTDDFLARWGGEEFVALLFDNSLDESLTKLENLRKKIAKLPFMFKGNRVSVTVSIGLIALNQHKSIEEAFDAADKLLYEAKNSGRNQTCTTTKN